MDEVVATPTENSQPMVQDKLSGRVNPRCHSRSIIADIVTLSGHKMHGISHDVSAFGASFIINSNREALQSLQVGDEVRVSTTTARALRAEINSIRTPPGEDSLPLVGLKLLDGKRWFAASESAAPLTEEEPS